jgi:hypothetical protein
MICFTKYHDVFSGTSRCLLQDILMFFIKETGKLRKSSCSFLDFLSENFEFLG